MQPNISQCLIKRPPVRGACVDVCARVPINGCGCGQNRAEAPPKYLSGSAFLRFEDSTKLAISFIKFREKRFAHAVATTERRAKVSKSFYKSHSGKGELRQPSCLSSLAFRTASV